MAEADLAVRIVPSVGALPAADFLARERLGVAQEQLFLGERTPSKRGSAVAPYILCALEAGHAHARLDTWAEALPWVLEALHGDRS